MQHLAAEKKQSKHGKESQARCQDSSAQSLINTFIDDVRKPVPPQQFDVLAYTVEDHDGVIIRVPDQGQNRGNHRQGDLPVEQRESPHRDQRIVEHRHHRRDSIDPFKPQREVDQHPAQGI